MLEPTRKDPPHPKMKKKMEWNGRRDAITIKSNPIPTVGSEGGANHNLENNNTKEMLSLFWWFWASCQSSQLGDLGKGLGIPRGSDFEGQWDLIIGLLQGSGKQRLNSWEAQTNKILCAQRPREKQQWPHQRLNQTYLRVLEGLLWRCGLAAAHCGDGGASSNSPGRGPLASVLLEVTISHAIESKDPRAELPQAKQQTGQELNPPLSG